MRRILAIAALLISADALAVTQTTHQAVPATPVGSKDLAAPKFHSTTRDLNNIVGKEEGKPLPVGKVAVGAPIDPNQEASPEPEVVIAPQTPTPTPVASPSPTPTPTPTLVPLPVKSDTDASADTAERKQRLRSLFDGIQSVSHNWHDFIEIIFGGAIVFFTRRLTIISRNQHKHLTRAVRAAEMAAEAAKKSADMAEAAIKNQKSS